MFHRLKKGMAILLIVLLLGTGYVFLTPSGSHFRLMLGGSMLTSQHEQLARIFLTKGEYVHLLSLKQHPPTKNSEPAALPTMKQQKSLEIQTDTLNTSTYTAKVLIINDPTTLHLVPSTAKNSGQTLKTIVQEYQGKAGINAGGFYDPGGDSNGGQLIGLAISDGKLLGSVSKTKKIDMCGFTKDGKFVVGNYTLDEIRSMHITQAVNFGPQLIVNHENMVSKQVNEAYGWAPRTAIGQDDKGRVIMVITDGRFYYNKHRGASMSDLVDIFQKYGAANAYALDGGGSTTMINNNQLLMKPATNTASGMRSLPDAFIVIPHSSDASTS